MDWQQIASLVVVGVTATLLIGRELRKRKRPFQGACGGECSCKEGDSEWGKNQGAGRHST
jgi:hypothetical protein